MAEKIRSHVGLRDLTDASKLAAKRNDSELLRGMMKRDWALNRSYFQGQQFSFWNPQMVRVEDLPVDSGPKWKVRFVSNQIEPGLTHYVAQLTKTRPTIDAEPDSGSNNDIKAAQMAESLYEYLWDDKQLNSKCQDALMEAGLSGGYWKITWDALAGKPMTFTIGPDGQPMMDDELAAAFLEEFGKMLEETGYDPKQAEELAKKTVYLGDIKIEVMSSENVLLDPAVSRFEDAQWAICRHSLDPDEIEARWGKKVEPNTIKTGDAPIPFTEDKRPETLREVFVGYFRPQPALPKGRYVAWIEGPNQILQDMDWPYPFNELPLVKFPGVYRPGSPYDDPIVTKVRPAQKHLNKTLSQMVEHQNLTMRPQMLAPVGSLRQKLTSEPGAVFEYNPVGNAIPQWRELPPIPQYMYANLAEMQQRIDKAFNRMPSTRDQLPARADSGHLLEGMQEAVADQLSPIILGLEDALARAGHLMAAFAQKYYEEPRLIKIRGAGGSVQVKKFMGADIAGGFTFRPRYGTGLPRTREGKRTAIMELLQEQLIDPQTALKHLDLADLKGVQAKLAQDEDHALRDHERIMRNQPINEQAIQDAQQQIDQFMQQAQSIAQVVQSGTPVDLNQDGQPDDPNEVMGQLQQQYMQLQQALQDAPWQPLPYENKAAHLEVHQGLLKSVEYDMYPPEMKAIFVKHYQLTMQALQSEQHVDPKDLPKINIMAKGTTSAKVMSKILNAHGIQTDEHEVAELPLDTEVYDSVDKANQGESANSPFSEEEQMLVMQQAQDEHALAQAKVAQEMGLAEVRASTQEDQAAQQGDQQAQTQQMAAESHAQKMRHAEEMHQAKLKQANKPPAKPAAKGK